MIQFCNWCPEPNNPSPEFHPNGQVEHEYAISEPKISIQGIELSLAESMTFRMALTSFLIDMKTENPLGEDKHGKEMQRLYLLHGRAIMSYMLK